MSSETWYVGELGETVEYESSFKQGVHALMDREIAEGQIKAWRMEFVDETNCVAVVRVWRRAKKDAWGDSIEELRSLVSKGDDGTLLGRVIQGSRTSGI